MTQAKSRRLLWTARRRYILFGRGEPPGPRRAPTATNLLGRDRRAALAQAARELGRAAPTTPSDPCWTSARKARGTTSGRSTAPSRFDTANALESARLGLGTTPGRTFNLFIGPGVDLARARAARRRRSPKQHRCARASSSPCAPGNCPTTAHRPVRRPRGPNRRQAHCRKKGQFEPRTPCTSVGPLEDAQLVLNHTVVEVATAADATGDLAIHIIGGDTDIPINVQRTPLLVPEDLRP